MEMMFEETLDRHYYTNDCEENQGEGNIERLDSNMVVPEDAVNYVIKKYNFKTT